MPSSDFFRHQTHMWGTDMSIRKTFIICRYNEINMKVKFKRKLMCLEYKK